MFRRLLFTLALVLSCISVNAQTKMVSGKTYVSNEYLTLGSRSVGGDSLIWAITWYDMQPMSNGLHTRGAQSVTMTFASVDKLIHCLEYISTAKEDVDTMVNLDDTMYGNTLLFGKYNFVMGTGSDEAVKQTAYVLGNVPKITLRKLRKQLAK